MTLKDAALQLNLEIPVEMEQIQGADLLCTEELLDTLQNRFDLFGEYFSVVKSALGEILKNEALVVWLSYASAYYLVCDHDHARDLPIPDADGTLAGDFLPLMVMLPCVESTFDHYVKRGFSDEEAAGFLNCIKLNIRIVETRILGRPALTPAYFRWLAHYLKCTIFDHGGLNFEMKKSASSLVYLKNKQSGIITPLAIRDGVHRSGLPLGSAGCEDEEGAFSATFDETGNAYLGHPIRDFRIQRNRESFSKEEWERFLSPNEDIINVHIPRQTDLSPEKVRCAYKEALEIVKLCYPEYTPKAFICSSWLMDPTLSKILGESSRISQFSAPYLRAPNKSAGKEVFSFVFRPDDANDLTKLPENTRLERALKEMYLKGEYIFAYTGMLPFEQI